MAKSYSCLLVGVDIHTLEIETVLGSGFSGLNILGLPTDITRDMRERVRSALESSGFPIPARRIVVSVGPTELIKMARSPLSHLDFAVAAGIIRVLWEEAQASHPVASHPWEFFSGELSLSGDLKPLNLDLIYEVATSRLPKEAVFYLPIPKNNWNFEGNYRFFSNIKDWVNYLKTGGSAFTNLAKAIPLKASDPEKSKEEKKSLALDTMSTILNNEKIGVSLIVAALGKHNILLAGEPGIGKSFAARKIQDLFLNLSQKELGEVKLIHGKYETHQPPFRAPHHGATAAALVGGFSLRPGEATLAHRGVLFLDELAEFQRNSLEALREPLDTASVVLSRAGGTLTYPAQFQLCATTNPCPCGYLFSKQKSCRCNPTERKKYLQKISGPLLDRFCMQVWAPSSKFQDDPDIFVLEIKKKWGIPAERDAFVDLFLKIQEGGRSTLEPQKDFPLWSSSLRSHEKIADLARTFASLFPNLVKHPNFFQDVLSYRSLQAMFSKKDLFLL